MANKPCKDCIHKEACITANPDMVKKTYQCKYYKSTADVQEIKHGYWEEWWDDNYLSYCHKCSECGSYPLTKEETMHDEVLSDFCPNCGAKMDGKE